MKASLIIILLSLCLIAQDDPATWSEYPDTLIWHTTIEYGVHTDTTTIVYGEIISHGDELAPKLSIGYCVQVDSLENCFRYDYEFFYYNQDWEPINPKWIVAEIDTIYKQQRLSGAYPSKYVLALGDEIPACLNVNVLKDVWYWNDEKHSWEKMIDDTH